jgi:hypothetical protein
VGGTPERRKSLGGQGGEIPGPMHEMGVFLREITSRLINGLAGNIPNLEERVDHILTKQVFGIGTTYLTSLLTRRSVYCSKRATGEHSVAKGFSSEAGNIWFERTEHSWVDGRCAHCGAGQKTFDRGERLETHAYAFIHTDDIKSRVGELFGGEMQFDVIIGNPPYQLSDDGAGTSAAPIYQYFVEQAKALEPRYLSMIIPARWFAGGKGLDDFRESMLADDRLRTIDDYLSASDVFPGVGLKGGVCFFLWDRENPGACLVTTHFKDETPSSANRQLLEAGLDVFIRFNEGLSILKKVVTVETGEAHSLLLPESKRFDRMVSSRKPFAPSPISSQCPRCSGVACNKRGNHASGTDISRPSLSATRKISSEKDTLVARGSDSSVKMGMPRLQECVSLSGYKPMQGCDLRCQKPLAFNQLGGLQPEFGGLLQKPRGYAAARAGCPHRCRRKTDSHPHGERSAYHSIRLRPLLTISTRLGWLCRVDRREGSDAGHILVVQAA